MWECAQNCRASQKIKTANWKAEKHCPKSIRHVRRGAAARRWQLNWYATACGWVVLREREGGGTLPRMALLSGLLFAALATMARLAHGVDGNWTGPAAAWTEGTK
jgi:hypothetical protein